MSSPKMVVLKSSDGETFEVEETVAMEWQTIKHIFENGCAGTTVPLPNVTSEILAKVIDYCKHHTAAASVEDLRTFDEGFVEVDQDMLIDLIQAANYLNIKSLLDLTCQKMADTIQDQTPEEIREMLNIENDYTPEEEEELRRQFAWAFE